MKKVIFVIFLATVLASCVYKYGKSYDATSLDLKMDDRNNLSLVVESGYACDYVFSSRGSPSICEGINVNDGYLFFECFDVSRLKGQVPWDVATYSFKQHHGKMPPSLVGFLIKACADNSGLIKVKISHSYSHRLEGAGENKLVPAVDKLGMWKKEDAKSAVFEFRVSDMALVEESLRAFDVWFKPQVAEYQQKLESERAANVAMGEARKRQAEEQEAMRSQWKVVETNGMKAVKDPKTGLLWSPWLGQAMFADSLMKCRHLKGDWELPSREVFEQAMADGLGLVHDHVGGQAVFWTSSDQSKETNPEYSMVLGAYSAWAVGPDGTLIPYRFGTSNQVVCVTREP